MKAKADAMTEEFGVDVEEGSLAEWFNIAPSQAVPAIRDGRLSLLKWGLVPAWSKEPKVSFSNINARRETVATSNAFRSAFKSRRCLMPASGFFEWFPGPPKVPHYFRVEGQDLFAFAGIWEAWKGRGEADPLETCALITTEANDVVAPVHARMPVILRREDYGVWLDPKAKPDDLLALLEPYAGAMTDSEVGAWVNSPRHEGPRCVEPA